MPDYTGNMYDTGGGVYNVKAFGATGNGTTDDTAAIQSACNALQAAGGGTLLFPRGSYRIFSEASYPTVSATTSLTVFTSLAGVEVRGYGATLVTTRPGMTTPQGFRIFEFVGCTNVSVVGLRGTGHTQSGGGAVLVGAHFTVFWGGCRNVNVEAVLTGFYSAMMVIAGPRDSGQPFNYATNEDQRSRGIRFALDVTNCGYGVNFQFSGDDVEGGVVSNGLYRSYFPYGVRDHRVRVDSRNHQGADALLTSYGGRGLENVELWYANTGTTSATTASNGVAGVEVSFADETAGTLRNVRITYDVKYLATQSFGPALRIIRHNNAAGLDTATVARGHKLHLLRLSGRIEGPGTPFDFNFATSRVDLEEFRGIELSGLALVGTAAPVLDLRAVKDQVTFRNVIADQVPAATITVPVQTLGTGG